MLAEHDLSGAVALMLLALELIRPRLALTEFVRLAQARRAGVRVDPRLLRPFLHQFRLGVR